MYAAQHARTGGHGQFVHNQLRLYYSRRGKRWRCRTAGGYAFCNFTLSSNRVTDPYRSQRSDSPLCHQARAGIAVAGAIGNQFAGRQSGQSDCLKALAAASTQSCENRSGGQACGDGRARTARQCGSDGEGIIGCFPANDAKSGFRRGSNQRLFWRGSRNFPAARACAATSTN